MKLRLLFDQHVSVPAFHILRQKGIDVVHVADVGMSRADDATILHWAIQHDRIVVTRNCRDFAPLVEALAKRGETFPGVLFLATSLPHADVGTHVRALSTWLASAEASRENPVRGSFAFIRAED